MNLQLKKKLILNLHGEKKDKYYSEKISKIMVRIESFHHPKAN